MLIDKLASLGAAPTGKSKAEKQALLDVLRTLYGPLPATYEALLTHFGGDISLEGDVVYAPDVANTWTDPQGLDRVELFYGLTSRFPSSSIAEVASTYVGRIPAGWLPVAAAPGGNQICMRTRGASAVAFWDHESEGIPQENVMHPASEGGLFAIAPTLEDFITRLRVQDEARKKLDVKVNLRF